MTAGDVRRRGGYRMDGADHVEMSAWSAGLSGRTAVFAWIAWYSGLRLHSSNDYLKPIEREQNSMSLSASYHPPWPHNPGVHLPPRGGPPAGSLMVGST